MKSFSPWLWAAFAVVFGLKLALVSGLPVHIVFSPHDDSLYLSRALHLLNDGSFGPYDSRVLAKLPGMSIWLAGLRALGLPYLITMNFLYAGAGLYVLLGLRRCGMHGLVLLAIWALYLLNPVSMSQDWLRILREPLSSILLVTLLGAVLHILVCVREGRRFWPHLLVFCMTFASSMLLREEDKLLWGLLLMFAGVVFLDGLAQGRNPRWSLRRIAPLLVAPALVALGGDLALRQAVENRYGLPILHDYGEGEFPRLLAAIRSIDSKHDNRLVMVTQEALTQLRTVAPLFVPVIDGLPPPGPGTYSCRLQGVCTEWSNGWMPFWIKDAAFAAGLTPDLPAAQNYFRDVRERIEAACDAGQLKCTSRGTGFLPPFELRWTRAFTQAFAHLLEMLRNPLPDGLGGAATERNVSPELRHMAQMITMDVTGTKVATGAALVPLYADSFEQWRWKLMEPHLAVAAMVLVLSLIALFYCWTAERVHPPGVLLWMVTLFFAYSALRLLALAYVATFIGPFDPRIVFSTYTAALLFCPAAIAEAIRLRRRATHGRRANQSGS